MLALVLNPLQALAASRDLILVLDNSGSMKKNDPEFLTGVAVRKFLQDIDGDNRIAILIFDQSVRLLMPLTTLTEISRENFLRHLDEIDFQGLHTDSPAAIERAIYELKVHGRREADRSIVFMTDGIVDTGNEVMDAEKAGWLRNDLAAEAADLGIRIFGIAFTEEADFMLIQSLSQRTAGEYFRAYSAGDIESVFRRIMAALSAKQTLTAKATAVTDPAESYTTQSAPLKPAPLPELELPPAAPLSRGGAPLAEQPETDASRQAALLPTIDDAATAEAALPTLSTAETELEVLTNPTSPHTLEQNVDTMAAEMGAAHESAADADAAEAADALPLAGPDVTEAQATELPAWLLTIFAAGVAVAFLSVTAMRRRNREAPEAPAPPEFFPKAFLNDLGGVTENPSYELGETLTVIGRVEGSEDEGVNYVVIPEPTVGRRHALIEFRNHCFWINDQNSLNGTFINDQRIDGDTRLNHGDRIRFHCHEFEFLLLDMIESDQTMSGRTVFAEPPRSLDAERREPTFASMDPDSAARSSSRR